MCVAMARTAIWKAFEGEGGRQPAQQPGDGAGQGGREGMASEEPFIRNGEVFRALLKRHREGRRWSQERLATESEMDHSTVSRLETGSVPRPARRSPSSLVASNSPSPIRIAC